MNTRLMDRGWSERFEPARKILLLAVLCLTVGALGRARAEEPDPSSRVARISYIKGRVSMQPTESDAWVEARINHPLTSGDQLWTEPYSRSELQIGNASLQIDASTQLRLLELSDEVLQIEVTQGVVNLHVRRLERGATVEVDTPNAAVSALEPGTYRIEVAAEQDRTLVQVREGSAEAAGERQSFNLRYGEQLTVQGTSRLSAAYDDVPRMDEFDRWADDRNQRAERASAARYVSSDVIGYEDLDDYGNWRWNQSYGYVWQPSRIASDWAPYRYGQWTWVSPWGWTWIDAAPWGFAPFHYGRWAQISNRWCWVPGPRTARAIYAPALVAWVGTPGLNVAVNFGSQPVGWIPLGPREVYRPYYRGSDRYVFNINVNNSLLDRNEFERGYRRKPHEENYGNRHAMSVVTSGALISARPVNNNLVHGNNGRLQAMQSAPVVRPETTSILGGERRTAPPQVNSREVMARRQPFTPAVTANPGINREGNIGSSASLRPEAARDARVRSNVRVITPSPSRRFDSNGSGPNPDSRSRAPRLDTESPGIRSSAEELQPPRSGQTPMNRPYGRPPAEDDRNGSGDRARVPPTENARGAASNANELRGRTNSWIRDEAPGRGRTADRQTPRAPETAAPMDMTPRSGRSESMPNRNSEMRSRATPPQAVQPGASSTPPAEANGGAMRTPRGDRRVEGGFDRR